MPAKAKKPADNATPAEIISYISRLIFRITERKDLVYMGNNPETHKSVYEWVAVGPTKVGIAEYSKNQWFELFALAQKAGLVDEGEQPAIKVVNRVQWEYEGNKYALTYSAVNVFAGRGMLRTQHEFKGIYAPGRK